MTNDPCNSPQIYDLQDILHGGIHSHPYFNSNQEYLRGLGCQGATVPLTAAQLANKNNSLQNFSGPDKTWSHGADVPIYMLVPSGGTVKRYFEGDEVTLP